MASGRHHYRVNTQGDRRRDCRADDRLSVFTVLPIARRTGGMHQRTSC